MVQAGTLRRNDILSVGGGIYGRVRAMRDWNNAALEEVPPGTPAKILGFKASPQVGDIIEVPAADADLKRVKKGYTVEKQSIAIKPKTEEESHGDKKFQNVVLKADVLGSLEAISGTLEKLQNTEVGVAVVSRGLGNITDTDVLAAEAAKGVVMGFNVLATREAEILARDKKVEIKIYKVIYDLFDELKKRLQDLLPAEIITTHLGKLEVLAIFRSDKSGQVIGGRVKEGKLQTGANAVLYRGEQPMSEGVIAQLQSGKQETKEVHLGQECGVKVTFRSAVLVGDVVDVFTEEKKERKLVLPQ
jgi:translation initiation factor IF-2